jgi:hypothetical protein
MTNEELVIILAELYEKHNQKLIGNKKYKFKIDEKREQILTKFVEELNKKVTLVGENFLNEYLTYAFGKYAGRKNPWGGFNRFPISWIVSKTLLKKYLKEPSGMKWFLKNKLQKSNKTLNNRETNKIILKSSFTKEEEAKEKLDMVIKINDFEEIEKARYYNSIKGRIWCVDFTTLFNPVSSLCVECKFAEKCKQLLKDNYFEIYKKRGLI